MAVRQLEDRLWEFQNQGSLLLAADGQRRERTIFGIALAHSTVSRPVG